MTYRIVAVAALALSLAACSKSESSESNSTAITTNDAGVFNAADNGADNAGDLDAANGTGNTL